MGNQGDLPMWEHFQARLEKENNFPQRQPDRTKRADELQPWFAPELQKEIRYLAQSNEGCRRSPQQPQHKTSGRARGMMKENDENDS